MAAKTITYGEEVKVEDAKQVAPAAERNKGPILEELKKLLPGPGAEGAAGPKRVLEVSSGTGQHAAFFSAALAHVTWQPSEYNTDAFPSIEAWSEGCANCAKPVELDASKGADAPASWNMGAEDKFDLILNVNMIHISPWECTTGLLAGAAKVLAKDGVLATYGPFKVDGEAKPESNAKFDGWLKRENPAWGLRDIADVAAAASPLGLVLADKVDMPANNFMLLWKRAPAAL